jgi:hypothetical protein
MAKTFVGLSYKEMMIIHRKFRFAFFALVSATIALAIGLATTPAYSSLLATRGDESWVGETRKMLAEMTASGESTEHDVGVDQIISLGVPAYDHLLDRVSKESSYVLTFLADGMPRIIIGELSKVMPFGGVPLEFDDFKSSAYAKRMLVEVSGFLPTRWLERVVYLNRERKLTAERASRGMYRKGKIKTNNLKTSLHELVHAYEDESPASLEKKLRSEFYERRTKGKKLRHLSRITNLYFYESQEKFRAGFVYPYIGKERGVELMSMGIECLMWNRFDIWNRDAELTKFLLGMLIFFGR